MILTLASTAIKIVQEYERGVIFRLGRLVGAKGPGLFFIIPLVDKMVKVDLRVVTLDIPSQEAITKDNVTVKVNAVAYFRVVEPCDAIVEVEDFRRATYQIAQTSLRSVLGQSELDDLLAHREEINQRLQKIIDEQTEPWGIKVSIVEVKDVELPETLKRAMAAQAEAERESGPRSSSGRRVRGLAAVDERSRSDGARTERTSTALSANLITIAAEKKSTIIFPLPMELLNVFKGMTGSSAATSPAEIPTVEIPEAEAPTVED